LAHATQLGLGIGDEVLVTQLQIPAPQALCLAAGKLDPIPPQSRRFGQRLAGAHAAPAT
jgi:hypothetical protein